MDECVRTALEGVYHLEQAYAKSAVVGADGWHVITVSFRPYPKVVSPLGHVSVNQITEALVEAFFCAMVSSISDGSCPLDLNLESFRRHRNDFIFARLHMNIKAFLAFDTDYAVRLRFLRVYPGSGKLFILVEFKGIAAGKALVAVGFDAKQKN